MSSPSCAGLTVLPLWNSRGLVVDSDAVFKGLCREVLAYMRGEGRYNFSGLSCYDRDNAAFDAWIDLEQRIRGALIDAGDVV